jgi:hypothetical protein
LVLNAYLTTTRNYLHDPNGQVYSTAQLTAYINQGRGQVATLTGCCRTLQIVNTVVNQETYALPAINANGLGQVIGVMGISVPWGGNLKPTIDRVTWSVLQAMYRSYSGLVAGFPQVWGQYGDASGGLVYMFPIPSQVLASEWDCVATVLPLAADTDPELIPYPFTDAVPMYAAWQALIGAQRYQDAQAMMGMYRQTLKDARAGVMPVFVPSAY